MSLISTAIPNLINGVSQQPPSLRLPTQCEEMVNCYPSIVEGLIKRQPTEHIAELISGSTPGKMTVHMYNRDEAERYVVLVRDQSIKVFDLDGVEKTVATPDGVLYLDTDNADTDFRLITVADYTFIVNKSKTVAMESATTPVNGAKALVFVRAGNYSHNYIINVDGVAKAGYTTAASTASTIVTDSIATNLAGQLVTNLGAGWTVTRVGHVIQIVKDDGTPFTVTCTDSAAGNYLVAINSSLQRFSDLPVVAPHNFIVEITGDNTSGFDNYYVKFVADDESFSEGHWVETVAPGIQYQLDASTMPHILVRETDGTFTFKEATWTDRIVGDEDSAPNPSFVGKEINDITFFRNRLGFLAGQGVVLSVAGAYFNFWPETVLSLLDDAPIDLEASHNKVSILQHAVTFSDRLLLFSEQTQFEMSPEVDILSPRTATIAVTTEYQTDTAVRPVGSGSFVYFATTRGANSGLREYYINIDTDVNEAADITAHVPRYLPANIKHMATSTIEDVILCSSEEVGYKNRIYVYKYYWAGSEKLQSAWSYWNLHEDCSILGFDFINSDVYIVLQYPDGVFLEKIAMQPGVTDTNAAYLTHLDRRMTEDDCSSVTYDGGTNQTTFTLPFDVTGDELVVTRANGSNVPGVLIPVVSYGTNTIVVSGDKTTSDVWIGNPYTMEFTFSELQIREGNGGGSSAVKSGKIQLRNIILHYADSGYFQTTVMPDYRDTYTYTFTGRILGSGANVIGLTAIEEGAFRFPVMANSEEVTIKITSDSFLPVKIQSAEWEAFFTLRSRRV